MGEIVEEKKEVQKEFWTLRKLLIAVSLVWLLVGGLMYFLSPTWPDRGTFGDMFGSVNALFAGLAFAGIIYTIAIQRKELVAQTKAVKMQTEELALQRQVIEVQTEELKGQKEEAARSADQMEIQRKLLNYQLAISHVNQLIQLKVHKIDLYELSFGSLNYKGNEVLKYFVDRAADNYGYPSDIVLKFHSFFSVYAHLIEYIETSDLDEKHKEELRSLVRFNMSQSEATLIERFLREDPRLEKYIEKYELHKIRDDKAIK